MIEFKKDRYVSRIYFMGAQDAGFDVLGCLYRDPGEPFYLVFRFRYYNGDQSKGPFGSGDEKSWTRVNFQRKDSTLAEEEEALRTCSQIFNGLADQAKMALHTLPVCTSDPEAIAKMLAAQPWVHMKPAGAR